METQLNQAAGNMDNQLSQAAINIKGMYDLTQQICNEFKDRNSIAISNLLRRKEAEIEQEKTEILRKLNEYKRMYSMVKNEFPELEVKYTQTLVFNNVDALAAVARELGCNLYLPEPTEPKHWFVYYIVDEMKIYCEA